MTKVIFALSVLCIFFIGIKFIEEIFLKRKPRHIYARKGRVMTPVESEFFHLLVSEMGQDYYFFPQLHLDAIIEPAGSRKSRFSAFRHINQKSVDFVACGKTSLCPIFAIELDDKTHHQPKRIIRDREVERILTDAGIALVRIENHGRFGTKELARQISESVIAFHKNISPASGDGGSY